MDQDTNVKSHLQALPLDSSLLVLRPDIEEFFKVETGIQDTEELKKHIVQVQEEAYKVAHRSFPEPRSSVEAVMFSGLPVPLHSGVQIRDAQDR